MFSELRIFLKEALELVRALRGLVDPQQLTREEYGKRKGHVDLIRALARNVLSVNPENAELRKQSCNMLHAARQLAEYWGMKSEAERINMEIEARQ